jgi:hypothetical protein
MMTEELRKSVHKKVPHDTVIRVCEIYGCLVKGADYRLFHGKKLTKDRSYLSIPVGTQYRFLCKIQEDGIKPVLVAKHDVYDTYIRQLRKHKG